MKPNMKPNMKCRLKLDFEFDLFLGRRYVWDVGGIIETETEQIEFQYHVSLVKGKGITQREGLERLLHVLKTYSINVIVCHNVGAERSVLKEWCEREGIPMPKIYWVDTLALAKKTLPKEWTFSQEALLKRLGIDQCGEYHSALPDARGCGLLMERLSQIRQGLVPMPK